MDNTVPYLGTLTAEQFLFREIRIVAKLYLENKDLEEILEIVKKDNLFQYPTERQISRLTRACYKRVVSLNNEKLVYELAHAPLNIAKQINLYAMMRTYRLVWEFMILVIGNKYETQDFSFSRKDLNEFFTRLQEQNDDIAKWSDSTITKTKQVLTKTLVEVGYIDTNKSTELNNVYLFEDLEQAIRDNNDKIALKAFNCWN